MEGMDGNVQSQKPSRETDIQSRTNLREFSFASMVMGMCVREIRREELDLLGRVSYVTLKEYVKGSHFLG